MKMGGWVGLATVDKVIGKWKVRNENNELTQFNSYVAK